MPPRSATRPKPITDPFPNDHPAAAYSNLLDQEELASAKMCGTCHDIATPLGGPIERTFCEWSHSAFNAAKGGLTCASNGCHMSQSLKAQPIAAFANAPSNRRYHECRRFQATVPDRSRMVTCVGTPAFNASEFNPPQSAATCVE